MHGWTASQVTGIIIVYAHEGDALCPDDQVHLILVPNVDSGSSHPTPCLYCPVCGRQLSDIVFPSVPTSRLLQDPSPGWE